MRQCNAESKTEKLRKMYFSILMWGASSLVFVSLTAFCARYLSARWRICSVKDGVDAKTECVFFCFLLFEVCWVPAYLARGRTGTVQKNENIYYYQCGKMIAVDGLTRLLRFMTFVLLPFSFRSLNLYLLHCIAFSKQGYGSLRRKTGRG